MEQWYLVLTAEFCEQHAGYQAGVNAFAYRVTTGGIYVTSTNALNDFPELFTGSEKFRKLSPNDFPPTIDE